MSQPTLFAHAWFTPYQLLVYCTFAVVLLCYWGVGLAFLFVDLTGLPRCIGSRKLQAKVALDRAMLPRLVSNLLVGQLLVLLPFAHLQWVVHSSPSIPLGLRVDTELPGAVEVVLSLFAFIVIEEVLFYYSHRLLHGPRLYAMIHKVHHEFKAPIALAGAFAHPLELATGNVFPLWLGPLLLHSHVTTMWLWYGLAIVGTQIHHCGYRLRGRRAAGELPAPQPDFHDYHHEHFRHVCVCE